MHKKEAGEDKSYIKNRNIWLRMFPVLNLHGMKIVSYFLKTFTAERSSRTFHFVSEDSNQLSSKTLLDTAAELNRPKLSYKSRSSL